MKTTYTLESIAEFKRAAANVRGQDEPDLPALVGTLQIVTEVPGLAKVELFNDPNYKFSLPFKEFVEELCKLNSIVVNGLGAIKA